MLIWRSCTCQQIPPRHVVYAGVHSSNALRTPTNWPIDIPYRNVWPLAALANIPAPLLQQAMLLLTVAISIIPAQFDLILTFLCRRIDLVDRDDAVFVSNTFDFMFYFSSCSVSHFADILIILFFSSNSTMDCAFSRNICAYNFRSLTWTDLRQPATSTVTRVYILILIHILHRYRYRYRRETYCTCPRSSRKWILIYNKNTYRSLPALWAISRFPRQCS